MPVIFRDVKNYRFLFKRNTCPDVGYLSFIQHLFKHEKLLGSIHPNVCKFVCDILNIHWPIVNCLRSEVLLLKDQMYNLS